MSAVCASARGPCLLDMEVVSVLSGLTLRGMLKPIAAKKVRSDHCAFLKIRCTLIGVSGLVIDRGTASQRAKRYSPSLT